MKTNKVKSRGQKARRKKVIAKAIQVFTSLARGLVKVWHENKSFVITKEDAMSLTLEQLEFLVNEKND